VTGTPTLDPKTSSVIHRATISVRWGDMDSFKHVNNAQFLRYLEEARVQWLASIPGITLGDRISPVLASSNVNYRQSIEWPGDIAVELSIERIGNSSLTMGHRMVAADDASVLYSDGSVVMVWIDTQTGKSIPLPEAVRAACTH
jgi:acyl-CoA thioester hydrolase